MSELTCCMLIDCLSIDVALVAALYNHLAWTLLQRGQKLKRKPRDGKQNPSIKGFNKIITWNFFFEKKKESI